MEHPETEIAYLTDGNRCFYATQPKVKECNGPHSVVTRLIQGIYEKDPEQARRITRSRIYTNLSELDPMSYGMLKVAAKRIQIGNAIDLDQVRAFAEHGIDLTDWGASSSSDEASEEGAGWLKSIGDLRTDSDIMQALYHRISQDKRVPQTYLNDRPVACVLVQKLPESSGVAPLVLSAALNTNSKNKTLHAEVNLVQSYFRRTGGLIPPHSTLYVTLQCCRMCAGMLWMSCVDKKTFRVIYGSEDLGPHAKNTILKAGTQDRKRFCADPSLHHHLMEFAI